MTPSSAQRKKRPATYGKRSSPATFDSNRSFFHEEPEMLSMSASVTAQMKSDRRAYSDTPVAKRVESSTPRTNTHQSELASKDIFDISSSEAESIPVVIRRPALSKAVVKRPLVDDRAEQPSRAASLPDKRPRLAESARKSVSFAEPSSQPQPLSLPHHSKAATKKALYIAETVRQDSTAVQGLSARERLKHRRGGGIIHEEAQYGHAMNGARDLIGLQTPSRSISSTFSPSVTSAQIDIPANVDSVAFDNNNMDIQNYDATWSSQPSTTRSISRSSPRQAIRQSGGLTPRQDRLWKDLFADVVDGDASASKLLRSSEHVVHTSDYPAAASVQRSQTRLVDRLKAAIPINASAPSTDEQESDDVMTDSMTEDGAMETTVQKRARTTIATPGSRTTYTQQRSHLAEDNLEDAMLLNLGATTIPSTPRSSRRRDASRSQYDAYSLDDDEDEPDTPAGKIRSVHELRAQGRISRIKAEVEDLFQDITNQSPSADTQRTAALVRLLESLLDEAFAKAVIQTGHDIRLFESAISNANNSTKPLFIIASMILMTNQVNAQALEACQTLLSSWTSLLLAHDDLLNLVQKQDTALKRYNVRLQALFDKVKESSTLWPERRPSTLHIRTLYLRALEMLVCKLDAGSDASSLLDDDGISLLCSNDGDEFDKCLVVSILEALSLRSPPSAWPSSVIEIIANMPNALADADVPEHTVFLAYRLCLNVTNDRAIDHFLFARAGRLKHLLHTIIKGFSQLRDEISRPEEQRKLQIDTLIIAVAIMINLSEYSKAARKAILEESAASMLSSVVAIFQEGYERTRDAESVDETTSNVPYGWLSVMLANFSQDPKVREFVRLQLKGQKLDALVTAVEEFILHHQKVDTTQLEGAEGREMQSHFTARLKDVLRRLRE